jgi:hypothetical protein
MFAPSPEVGWLPSPRTCHESVRSLNTSTPSRNPLYLIERDCRPIPFTQEENWTAHARRESLGRGDDFCGQSRAFSGTASSTCGTCTCSLARRGAPCGRSRGRQIVRPCGRSSAGSRFPPCNTGSEWSRLYQLASDAPAPVQRREARRIPQHSVAIR